MSQPPSRPSRRRTCEVLLVRPSGTVTAVDLPDDVLAVSLAPLGNHLIYVAETVPGSPASAVVFVAGTDGSGEAVSVTAVGPETIDDWPVPMWSQDGRVVIVADRDGQVLIDVRSGGALDVRQVVGHVEGDIVGFVSIRHLDLTAGSAAASSGTANSGAAGSASGDRTMSGEPA